MKLILRYKSKSIDPEYWIGSGRMVRCSYSWFRNYSNSIILGLIRSLSFSMELSCSII